MRRRKQEGHHGPVPIPHEPVPPVPRVVAARTEHLSNEDAETVTKVACKLKDMGDFVFAESYEDRLRIASEQLSDVLFEEDKLATTVDLAQDMLAGVDVDAVDTYCEYLG
jgi:hypothetical protein